MTHFLKYDKLQQTKLLLIFQLKLIVTWQLSLHNSVRQCRQHCWEKEGQHPLTGQRAANFRLLANQWTERRLVTQWRHGCRAMRRSVCNAGASNGGRSLSFRYQGNGATSFQYIDTIRKAIDCATTLPLTVFIKLIMKLCSRLFVLYCRNCPKDDKFTYFIPILRKLGVA